MAVTHKRIRVSTATNFERAVPCPSQPAGPWHEEKVDLETQGLIGQTLRPRTSLLNAGFIAENFHRLISN